MVDYSLKCKLMVKMLKEVSLRWYMSLQRFSMSSYRDLTSNMVHHFSSIKHIKVSTTSLFNVHYGYFESCRSICQNLMRRPSRSPIQIKTCLLELSITTSRSGTLASSLSNSRRSRWKRLWLEHVLYQRKKRTWDAKELGGRNFEAPNQ